MDELVFENPPPPRGTNAENEDIAEKLRTRPREWARIGAFSNADMLAANIKRGRPKAYEPAGAFEAVSRRVGQEWLLYVRYVGEPTTDSGQTEPQES
ncbi:hypothetical protein AB0E06_23490 [Streptomyces sp. NPDC048109]|uniref:hypothetical protein n=1 Tax=unclassified Streptomyces TaxID=2593676 RepID=UPI0033ED9738